MLYELSDHACASLEVLCGCLEAKGAASMGVGTFPYDSYQAGEAYRLVHSLS